MSIKYSVVIPVMNEEDNVKPLVKDLEKVMTQLGESWELLYIDDGSTDNTLKELEKLKAQHPQLRVIIFDQNYGQSSAFDAGFQYAKGEIIITMDGDRQNDPQDIPKMLHHLVNFDMVCGWRKDRKDPWTKTLTSKFSNSIRKRVCKDGLEDGNCSLKVFYREKMLKVKMYHGMHRFMPALFLIEGFTVGHIPVKHHERPMGVSKYSIFNRFLGPICDLLAVQWMRKRHLRYRVDKEM